jgi:hypothetical protein
MKAILRNRQNITYEEYANMNSYMWMEGMIHHYNGDLKPLFRELGINQKIWNEWKTQNPKFQEVEISGQRDIQVIIESALLNRAVGFYVTEEQKSEKTGDTITYHRYYPPNVDALKFLCINLMPEKYDRANARMDMPQVIINALNFEQKGAKMIEALEDGNGTTDDRE